MKSMWKHHFTYTKHHNRSDEMLKAEYFIYTFNYVMQEQTDIVTSTYSKRLDQM